MSVTLFSNLCPFLHILWQIFPCPHFYAYGTKMKNLLTQEINCLFYKVSLLADLKSLQLKQGEMLLWTTEMESNIKILTNLEELFIVFLKKYI